MKDIPESLKQYIDTCILPMYDSFDAAHHRDHAQMVIDQSFLIAQHYQVNNAMVYVIAVYHDTGLSHDRKTHHLVSGQIIRNDAKLKGFFTDEQIEIMAQAVEDHRASIDHEPRSIYGKIVAEADRFIDPYKIIERTVQYGLEHYPELDRQGQYQRTQEHMHSKYADGGYLKLWFPESPNVQRLEELRAIIRNEAQLQSVFDEVYNGLMSEPIGHCI